MWVHWEIRFLRGAHKKQYIGRNFVKKVGLGHFSGLREGGSFAKKRGGGDFWGGVDTPMDIT